MKSPLTTGSALTRSERVCFLPGINFPVRSASPARIMKNAGLDTVDENFCSALNHIRIQQNPPPVPADRHFDFPAVPGAAKFVKSDLSE